MLKKSKGNWERQVAVYLSKVFSGKKNKEVGGIFGIKGPAASGIIKAIEGRLYNEKKLKKEIEGLKEMLNE